MAMKNKSEILALYCPKLFTMHVNDTSRPCGTVKLSNGAKNTGSEVAGERGKSRNKIRKEYQKQNINM